MMNSTASPISACLMPMRKALTGARYRGSSCALTRNVSQRPLGPRSKAILSARNGSLTVGTVGCCGKDGLRLLKGLGHDNGRRASLPPAIALRYLWLGG